MEGADSRPCACLKPVAHFVAGEGAQKIIGKLHSQETLFDTEHLPGLLFRAKKRRWLERYKRKVATLCMAVSESPQQRLLFGLKLRYYRMAKGFLFQDLSTAANISKSYLNEIEMGQKYPRQDKLLRLAAALDVEPHMLTSSELPKQLAPLQNLLATNFLQELPLEMMGLDLQRILAMLSQAPTRVSAFISTLIELSRTFSSRERHFYFGVLRAYLELHDHYFEDIEAAAAVFVDAIDGRPRLSASLLEAELTTKWQVHIDTQTLGAYPALKSIRSVFVPAQKTLFLEEGLNKSQKVFALLKEIGFRQLGLEVRAYTGALQHFHSFDEVLNHFRAGYFASAVMIPQHLFKQDLSDWLQQPQDFPRFLEGWLVKYACTPEVVFQRITNLLPTAFGLKGLFYVQAHRPVPHRPETLSKELHLGGRHWPHLSHDEHFCARHGLIRLLDQPREVGLSSDTQFVKDDKTGRTYFCVTAGWNASQKTYTTATLGIDTRQSAWVYKRDGLQMHTGHSCERCPLECSERRAEPTLYRDKKHREAVRRALKQLIQ
jgi:predicted transcriptional regulator